MGRNFNAAKEFKRWLTEAGFVDVVEKQYFSPVNGWPVDRNDKLIGHWCKHSGRPPSFLIHGRSLVIFLLNTESRTLDLKMPFQHPGFSLHQRRKNIYQDS